VNPKVNYGGVQKADPPKKRHQDSTPVQHLDTLNGNTKVPGSSVSVTPSVVPKVSTPVVQRKLINTRESLGDGALAGLGIGSIAVFLLIRTIM
jgi:hypothetical protein